MRNFTIYVTGGGEYFYTTLNGVAMIFNDGKLIYAVILLGSMFALLTGAWYFIQKNIGSGLLKTHTWIEHAFVMVILSFLAFVPTRVVVQDIYGQQNVTPIDNVPLIISFPAAMFSGVNFDIFRTIDTAYQSTTGSTMAVSENGFVTPLKLMMAMRGGLQEVAPEAYQSWFNYIGSCLYNTASTTGGMAQSPDVASFLTLNGKDGGFVKVFLRQAGSGVAAVQDGVIVTCSEAKTLLDLRMEALFASGTGANPSSDVDRLINLNMGEANRNAANGRWTWADAMTAANGFQLEVGASAQSAQQFMKNSLMRSVVVDAFNCAANYLNSTDQMLCTQSMHDSMEQYKVDAAGQGSWFSQMMLPAMTILQLLFFAFSVVAFLYGIIRGAGAVGFIGKYFLFGAWVFSWLPFVAIINAFINWMVVDKMKMSSVTALTIENYDSYFQGLQASLALASNLLAATPLITLGFMTGSMFALSSFAQRLSSNDYFNEKNVAPNTVDVAPVMRHGSEFQNDNRLGGRSGATTYDQVSLGDAMNAAKESRRVETQQSQIQTADQFSQMYRAMEQQGGSQRITNTDTNLANATEGEMFQAGLRSMRSHMDTAGFSQQDKNEAEARARAGLEIAGMGGSVSAAMAKAMAGTQNKNVSSAMENMLSGMSSYAETTGRQLASAITSDSSFSTSKAHDIASGFSKTASDSESLAKSYAEISSRSNSVDNKLTADVSALGYKLEQDRQAGTAGKGIDRKINDAYNDLINRHGRQSVDGVTQNKLQEWTRSGGNFRTMTEMAQLQTIRAMGDGVAYSNIVSDLFGAAPASIGDAQAFQGVSGAAGSVRPQEDPNYHNARVEAGMPGAGNGLASFQSTGSLKGQLNGNNDLDQSVKGRVAAGMDDKLNSLANGVLNHNVLTPQGARDAQLIKETATSNILSPPKDEEEYRLAQLRAASVESTTGASLPPIPPDSVKEQWVQKELSSAQHPTNVRGDTPQEREANMAQSVAEARARVEARVADIQQKNNEAAGSTMRDARTAAGGGLGNPSLQRPVPAPAAPAQPQPIAVAVPVPSHAGTGAVPSETSAGPDISAFGAGVGGTNDGRQSAQATQSFGSDYVSPESGHAGSSFGQGVPSGVDNRPASASPTEAAPMRRSSFPEQPLPRSADAGQQAGPDDKPAIPPAPNGLRHDVDAKGASGRDQRGGGQSQRPGKPDGDHRKG